MQKIIIPILALFFLIVLPVWLGITLLPKKSGLDYNLASFSALEGWRDDHHSDALSAFMQSCGLLLKQNASKPMPDPLLAGNAGDWHLACRAAETVDTNNSSAARDFFENNFQPISVSYNGETQGQFTGYHEPLLKGSLSKSERYHVPLHAKPRNLIQINLGEFRRQYKGVSLTGLLKGNRMVPFHDRSEIVAGALAREGLEILWVDSEVDAFFLQVQGSGRVLLDDGNIIGVGFAGKNGQPYRSIGRILIENGEMKLEEVSAQSIKQWLQDNPERASWLLNQNPSYVFFHLLDHASGPYGSAAVTLTAERSLAVDRRYLPLHAPVWLDASHPDHRDALIHEVPFKRLMIAQDTGGAIKGAVRGDVFWGYGAKADEIAGRMNNAGKLYLLLPQPLAMRLIEQ